jgi:hypothetical protein
VEYLCARKCPDILFNLNKEERYEMEGDYNTIKDIVMALIS